MFDKSEQRKKKKCIFTKFKFDYKVVVEYKFQSFKNRL